jgi:hypothetical protein
MNHLNSTYFAALLAIFGMATASPALAQGQTSVGLQGEIAFGETYRLASLSGPVATPFGRSVALDMDGDLMMDHAVIVGRTVRMLFAPGLFEAPVGDVQSDVDGISMMKGGLGSPDLLLTAGASGVRAYNWSKGELRQWRICSEPAFAVAAIPTPIGAPRKLAILLANQRSVLLADEVVFGNRLNWDTCLMYEHPNKVYDLAVADLGGDGRFEFCMSVDGGIFVERPYRKPLVYIDPDLATSAIAVIGESGEEQWLVWVAEYIASGNELIGVFDDTGLVDLEVINGGVGLVGIDGADTSDTLDGLLDLSVSWDTSYAVAQINGIPTPLFSPQFDVQNTSTISIIDTGLAPPTYSQGAWPEVVDVDNDGDPDTIFPIQEDGSIFVYLCAQENQADRKPWIVQDESLMFRQGPTIELHMGVEADPATITNGTPTAFEVLVYHRLSPDEPVRTDPIFVDIINFAAATQLGNGALHFDCVIPFLEAPDWEGCTSFDSMYWIVVRMVETVGSPGSDLQVLKRFPARLYGVEGQKESSENWEFIDEHQPVGSSTLTIKHECLESQGSRGGGSVPVPHTHIINSLHSEAGGSGKELPCLPGPMDDKKVPLTKKAR